MTYPQQPGYPPQGYPQQYPPQQPPPQLYPTQPPAPQGYYPQQPGGYGQPAPAAPPPPPQLAKGSVTGFFNQPNGAFGKALKFDVVGRWYLMRVARDVNDGDSRQATDPKTRQPLWNPDGSPKLQLCIPVVVTPGLTPEHATGAATLYVQSRAHREEVARAMAEAGVSEIKAGDVIYDMWVSERSSGMGNAAKVHQIVYTPAANVEQIWGAQAPPLAPLDTQQQQAQQAPPPPPPIAPAAATPAYPPVYGAPQQPPQAPQAAAPAPPQQYAAPAPQPQQAPPPVQQPVAQVPPPAPEQPGPPPAPPGVPQPPPPAPGAPQMTTEQQVRFAALANMVQPQPQQQQAQPTG